MPTGLRDYHVVLADGVERNVRAQALEIGKEGTLEFYNGKELVLAYNYNAWKAVEVERLDDKG